ncbi:MAG: antibiotic biosynthesis monooxygenase [Hyphomicrobium sp.]
MPRLIPFNSNFPIDRQLGIDAGPIVLVNVFTLDKLDEPSFLRIWREDASLIKQQPGFISSQLHRAIGENPMYLNYAVWESTAHYRAVLDLFRSQFATYPSSTVASPHLFQKIAVAGICVA